MTITDVMRAALGVVLAALLIPLAADARETGCILYEHRDFGGVYWEMERNSYMQMGGGEPIGVAVSHGESPIGYYEPSWNDHVSSFDVVGPGCTLILYEHAGGWGDGATFTSDVGYTYVGDAWNDQASWADCNCIDW
jgi:hypothetical protein